MNDDILLYDEPISDDYEVLRSDPVIETDIDRIIEDSKKESISNNFIVGDSLYERQQIDKSNDIVLFSDVSYRNSNNQNVGIDNYTNYVLWENPNVSINFNSQIITLNDDISDYDLIGFEFRTHKSSWESYGLNIVPFDVFKTYNPNNYQTNIYSGFGYIFLDEYYLTRYAGYRSDNSVFISSCMSFPQGQIFDEYDIPTKIIGYKKITLSNNDIPNQIVSGNNIYNFNYYCGVSENTVSNDIIHKPISEYNTIESLGLYSFMIALGIGFYLLIRRAVFKWR